MPAQSLTHRLPTAANLAKLELLGAKSGSSETALIDNIALHPTPEGLLLTLMPAGLMPRLSAWLIDFLIRMIAMVIVGIISAFFGEAGAGILAIGYFLITWLYPVYFEVYKDGKTPGKNNQGIYVCHDDGTPISLQASMIRNLLRVADFLPLGFASGALTIMFTQRSQRIGDMVAGTLVVYEQQNDIAKLYKSIYGLVAQLPSSSSDMTQIEANAAAFDSASPIFVYPLTLNEQQALVSYTERLAFLSQPRQQEITAVLAPMVFTRSPLPEIRKIAVQQAVVRKAMMIQGQESAIEGLNRQGFKPASAQASLGKEHESWGPTP